MSDNPARLLLVDDDEAIRRVCGDALAQDGYEVQAAATGQEALRLFAHQPFEGAILDLVLPDVDGLSLLGALREADPEVMVVLMTGHATLEAAIEAVRRGAYDFLRKPFSALDLSRVVARGLEQRRLTVHNRELVQELDQMNRDLRHQVDVVTEELTAFLNLGRKLSTAEGALPLLNELLRSAMQLTGARSGAVLRLLAPTDSSAGGRWRCLTAAGEAAADLMGLDCGPEEALFQRCLESRRPGLVPELLADNTLAGGACALLGLNAALVLPLLAVTGTVGVLALFDPPEAFTDRQASLVKVLVAQAAEVVAQEALRGPALTGSKAPEEFIGLQDILTARRPY